METRRERKAAVVAEVREAKRLRRERRAELRAMSADDRRSAKAADRAAATEAKRARKAELKAMPRAERRRAKKRDRMYRKVWHRPRRIVFWVALVTIVALLAALVAPYVRDVSRLFGMTIDSSTPAGEAARAEGALVAQQISDEGIVLLKNEDALLPLDGQGVNVFGFGAFALRFGGGGSGGADQSAAKSLFEGLTEAGVDYNTALYDVMVEQGASTEAKNGTGLIDVLSSFLAPPQPDEPAVDYLTDDVLAEARAFSDVALVVVGNDGVEAQDFTAEQLALPANTRALLDRVTATFDQVIVVVNSGNAMELGFLDEYPQIAAALWIGTPGPFGAVSLGAIIAGEVNPSGRLTDTYADNVAAHPAAENFGDYRYDNIPGRAFIEYQEGIYVGYRFFETYYADDQAGYEAAVQYPFGYGLSYTSFSQALVGSVITDETVTLTVDVTNTGERAGKEVVQVYFSAPYTPGGIEKSAIELAGFDKTGLLAPGESETVTVSFPLRDMASYDADGREAFVLEPGTYTMTVAADVHTPLASITHEVTEEVVYRTDETTGTAIENRFGFARGDHTVLSRADWQGTFPDGSDRLVTASDAVLTAMEEGAASAIEPAEGELPTYGADNGISYADLEGVPVDDPRWQSFLDQLTLDEQIDLFSRGAYLTHAVDRLGIPSATLLDGPAGINSFFSTVTAASYPTQVVVASTWNADLARALGEAVGAEANAYGVQGWYAPGMNLHRTPQGGRNFEYFSEDPLLSGVMAAGMVAGAESKGVITFVKHFAVNDQETNARTGIDVWVDEQSLRELYLRPFEIAVKEGGARGAMSSFSHLGTQWAGGSSALLQNVLRDEWGFTGFVSTDAVLGGFMDPALAVRAGNDLMLAPLGTPTVARVHEAYRADPVGVGAALRERVHAVLFTLLQTDLVTR